MCQASWTSQSSSHSPSTAGTLCTHCSFFLGCISSRSLLGWLHLVIQVAPWESFSLGILIKIGLQSLILQSANSIYHFLNSFIYLLICLLPPIVSSMRAEILSLLFAIIFPVLVHGRRTINSCRMNESTDYETKMVTELNILTYTALYIYKYICIYKIMNYIIIILNFIPILHQIFKGSL